MLPSEFIGDNTYHCPNLVKRDRRFLRKRRAKTATRRAKKRQSAGEPEQESYSPIRPSSLRAQCKSQRAPPQSCDTATDNKYPAFQTSFLFLRRRKNDFTHVELLPALDRLGVRLRQRKGHGVNAVIEAPAKNDRIVTTT